ncbi:probable terpene synthase 6 [Gossypium hirsutum]|uniref:Probable terpene synthase 6 n=1 Tax=Gossypium hirsutum TaxID=3635 RepID=A0A1U8LS91_GOSHI|nr:probable terpene synthase 6 [Gossypium hirsutum]
MTVQVQGSGNTNILLCLSKAPSPPFPMLFPLRLHKAKRCCFVAAHSTSSTKATPLSSNHRESGRPLANFPPDIWGDHFLTLSFDISELDRCSTQIEVLKEMVKDMLMASTTDPLHNILLINSLCRLGVSYHFETEVEQQLTRCFDTLSQLIHNNDYNLHETAIMFQVFRSHGYNMSSDIFNKFKKRNYEFKISDIKEMITLYEAAQFKINGEFILDEAFNFTTTQLKSIVSQASTHYAQYIENALNCPYQKGVPRLEARQYICFYEKDEDEARNDTLLKFAKYDFNRIQMMLQQELSSLCSEWKEENMESRFPYARHRIVESFFSATVFYFEPCYARARNIYAKLLSTLAFIDDTYDAYGTYEELQHFTDAMQRFDISVIDELPTDYLKLLYETTLNVHNEIEDKVGKEGRSYAVSYTKNELKEVALAYLVERRWVHGCYMPTFDEYLETALKTCVAILSVCQALIGMEEADETAYQWLINTDNKLHKALNIIARLYDDISTNEAEEKRGLVCGTSCYMKQYGITRQEAVEAYREIVAWKRVKE